MKRLRDFLLTASILIAILPMAHAVCFAPEIRVDDEYFSSDLVFTGTIVRDQKVGLTPEGDYDGHIFSWRVDRIFRGPSKQGDIIQTDSGNDSGRFPDEAEEGHQVGRHFLIFAFVDPSRRENYAVDNCGNSTPLSKAARTIREVEYLPNRHGGLLYGVMFDGDIGVHITATGTDGRKYSTLSSERGRFAIHLPPGTYSVTASAPGRVYEDFELAYKSSKHLVVPDGGSAGLAFREKGWNGTRSPYEGGR